MLAVVALISSGCAADLGTVPGGGATYAAEINDLGVITGYGETAIGTRGFILRPGQPMVGIDPLGPDALVPEAINDASVVVGAKRSSTVSRPFRWDENTGVVELGSFGGPHGEATDINDGGVVVGWSTLAGGSATSPRAWVWEPTSKVLTPLASLPGNNTSYAAGINNAGQIVGWVYQPDGSPHAVLWEAGTHQIVDIGPSDWASEAHDINASGTIAGLVRRGIENRPARWLAGSHQLHLIGTLGGNFGCGNVINDAGVIVGSDAAGPGGVNGIHAFRWDPTTQAMTDLGTLGGSSSHAAGLNNAGVAVGHAQTSAGDIHAVQWAPI